MLQGPSEDVFAKMESSVEDMDTSDTQWGWFYLAECGKWHMFQTDSNSHCSISSEDIERSFRTDPHGSLSFTTAKFNYTLDFSVMRQINLTTLKQRPIKRAPFAINSFSHLLRIPVEPELLQGSSTKKWNPVTPILLLNTTLFRSSIVTAKKDFICENEAIPMPSHWENVNTEEPYQLIPLQKKTNEYNEVSSLFGKTMDSHRIKRIKRIQNLDLWEFFCRKKAQLKKKRGVPTINEQMLFHGTSNEFVEAICIHNFDWRINGMHAAVYGKGTYFARDASYSSHFCKESMKHGDTFQIHGVNLQPHLHRPDKVMFLARVLTGDYIGGDSKYMRPPSKDGSFVNLYDSCVDNTWNPKIFVIFDANQIYPEYLIEFC